MAFVLFYHQSCSECSESRHEYPESLLDALPIGIQPCSLLKQQKGQEASLERHMFFFFFFNVYIYTEKNSWMLQMGQSQILLSAPK